MLITKLIDKNKEDEKGIKNFYGVLEDGKQIDLQIMANNLVIPIFGDGTTTFGTMFFTSQSEYELSEEVVTELRDIYKVNNL